MRAVTIAGSPFPHSRSTLLLEFAARQLRAQGVAVASVSACALPTPALRRADADDRQLTDAIEHVAAADVVLVATPVGEAAYGGALRVFLDLLPASALLRKVALPIVTGGNLAHLLAVDDVLRPVLCALGAQYVLGTIYVADAEMPAAAEGGYQVGAAVVARLSEGLAGLLDGGPRTSLPPRRAGAPVTPLQDPIFATILLPDDVRCSA